MSGRLFVLIAISLAVTLSLVFAIPATAGIGVSREIKIGKDVAADLDKQFPETDNLAWRQEIEETGQNLVKQCGRQDIEYHFKIIRMGDELNAFALPGGYVYVTEPLWKLMSHDERAAILSHEIAHISERHWAKRYDVSLKKALGMLLATLILKPSPATLRMARTADSLVGLSYSRKDERAADELGLSYMIKGGYEPYAFVTVLEKLNAVSGDFPRDLKFLSTHPLTRDRVTWGAEQMQAGGYTRPVFATKKVTLPESMPEEEKPVVSIGDLCVTGAYTNAGAPGGVADILAIELVKSGQFHMDPAEAANNAPHYRLDGEVEISSGDATKSGENVVVMALHLTLTDKSGSIVRTSDVSLTRSGDPGFALEDPWVVLGIYTRCVERSLVGRTVLEAVRDAIYQLAPYPHLVDTPKVTAVDEKHRLVTLDAGRNRAAVGMTLRLEKPFGDMRADEDTGELLGREMAPIATFRVIEVGVDSSVAEVTFAPRAEWCDIVPGDKLDPRP